MTLYLYSQWSPFCMSFCMLVCKTGKRHWDPPNGQRCGVLFVSAHGGAHLVVASHCPHLGDGPEDFSEGSQVMCVWGGYSQGKSCPWSQNYIWFPTICRFLTTMLLFLIKLLYLGRQFQKSWAYKDGKIQQNNTMMCIFTGGSAHPRNHSL